MASDQMDASLDERVDNHFHSLAIGLTDTTGMMRHILDSLGTENTLDKLSKTLNAPVLSSSRGTQASFKGRHRDKSR